VDSRQLQLVGGSLMLGTAACKHVEPYASPAFVRSSCSLMHCVDAWAKIQGRPTRESATPNPPQPTPDSSAHNPVLPHENIPSVASSNLRISSCGSLASSVQTSFQQDAAESDDGHRLQISSTSISSPLPLSSSSSPKSKPIPPSSSPP